MLVIQINAIPLERLSPYISSIEGFIRYRLFQEWLSCMILFQFFSSINWYSPVTFTAWKFWSLTPISNGYKTAFLNRR